MFYRDGQLLTQDYFHRIQSELLLNQDLEGFFETMLCVHGQIVLQHYHAERLVRTFKNMQSDYNIRDIFARDIQCLELPDNAVIKYQVFISRNDQLVIRLMQVKPPSQYPEDYFRKGISLFIGSSNMPVNSTWRGKKSVERDFYNRLTEEYQDNKCAEALILNSSNAVVEGTKTNIFAVQKGCLITPALDQGGVAGVMRALIIQIALKLGISIRVQTVTIEALLAMDDVIVSNALIGIWPVREIKNNIKTLKHYPAINPVVKKLQNELPMGFLYA